jgi:uncharacterized membrane-anchored protein YhcB (DUF1043 family)
MGNGVNLESLKLMGAIIISIVGPIIGLLLILIKGSMEQGQNEIKTQLSNLNTNVNQLSQNLQLNVHLHTYHPSELIKKLEEMEERTRHLDDRLNKLEDEEISG